MGQIQGGGGRIIFRQQPQMVYVGIVDQIVYRWKKFNIDRYKRSPSTRALTYSPAKKAGDS